MQRVKKERNFAYTEIDVMQAGQEKWKSVYEFDTPVVRLTSMFSVICNASRTNSLDPRRPFHDQLDFDLFAEADASL